MKHKFVPLLFTLTLCFFGRSSQLVAQIAQIYDYELEHRDHWIVLMGVSDQIDFADFIPIKSLAILAEYKVLPFSYLGLSYNHIFPTFGRQDLEIGKGGYEVGITGKHFLHGRLTGHRSNYFVGFEVRKGVRFVTENFTIAYTEKSTYQTNKFLVKFGLEWHIKSWVFQCNLPLGIESVKYRVNDLDPGTTPTITETNFIIAPGILMGFTF
jgi:hypothetical protein